MKNSIAVALVLAVLVGVVGPARASTPLLRHSAPVVLGGPDAGAPLLAVNKVCIGVFCTHSELDLVSIGVSSDEARHNDPDKGEVTKLCTVVGKEKSKVIDAMEVHGTSHSSAPSNTTYYLLVKPQGGIYTINVDESSAVVSSYVTFEPVLNISSITYDTHSDTLLAVYENHDPKTGGMLAPEPLWTSANASLANDGPVAYDPQGFTLFVAVTGPEGPAIYMYDMATKTGHLSPPVGQTSMGSYETIAIVYQPSRDGIAIMQRGILGLQFSFYDVETSTVQVFYSAWELSEWEEPDSGTQNAFDPVGDKWYMYLVKSDQQGHLTRERRRRMSVSDRINRSRTRRQPNDDQPSLVFVAPLVKKINVIEELNDADKTSQYVWRG